MTSPTQMRQSPAHGGELKDLVVDPVRPVNPRASKILPYFPGYLFLRSALTEVGESTFLWMPYSQGLVRVGGEPAPVADFVVRALRARVAEIWSVGGLASPRVDKG